MQIDSLVVETERLRIRPLKIDDAKMVNTSINHSIKELSKFLPWTDEKGCPLESTLSFVKDSLNSYDEFCKQYAACVPQEEKQLPACETKVVFQLRFLIEEKLSSKTQETGFIGMVGYKDIDLKKQVTELGYWCDISKQGRGYITEAVTGLVNLAEAKLGIKTFVMKIDEKNEKSIGVAQRCGFIKSAMTEVIDDRLHHTFTR